MSKFVSGDIWLDGKGREYRIISATEKYYGIYSYLSVLAMQLWGTNTVVEFYNGYWDRRSTGANDLVEKRTIDDFDRANLQALKDLLDTAEKYGDTLSKVQLETRIKQEEQRMKYTSPMGTFIETMEKEVENITNEINRLNHNLKIALEEIERAKKIKGVVRLKDLPNGTVVKNKTGKLHLFVFEGNTYLTRSADGSYTNAHKHPADRLEIVPSKEWVCNLTKGGRINERPSVTGVLFEGDLCGEQVSAYKIIGLKHGYILGE